jgi:hypothetical protein
LRSAGEGRFCGNSAALTDVDGAKPIGRRYGIPPLLMSEDWAR